ncbi:MAG: hypothetical protein CMJ89_20865 [Planctomycetes bacterium]|nr:hypothetical protein [Planctomycetota bacterium]
MNPLDQASTFSAYLFAGITGAVAVVLLRAYGRSKGPRAHARGAVVLVIFLAGLGRLAQAGMLDDFDILPPPALLLFAASIGLGVVLALTSVGEGVLQRLGIAGVVGYQVFRVPVEYGLHRLFEEGALPVQMTWAGWNFDVLTGATAVVVAVWAKTGRLPRTVLVSWNLLGLALLINIVTIAVLSTPTPLRAFAAEPANYLPATFPYLWLPMFLVPSAAFGHLLVFRWLRENRSVGPPG